MADPVTITLAATTALNALSQHKAGKAADEAAKYEAAQLEQAGTEEFGAGTRRAYLTAREGERFISDQRAAQASSGGTTTDPQAVKQRATVERDIQYNVLNELFKGDVRRQTLRKKAAARRYAGKQARRGGLLGSVGTAIGGFGKTYQSYQANKAPKAGEV